MRPNNGLHPTRLSPLEIGGHTRFAVALVAKALSRSRLAGEAKLGRVEFFRGESNASRDEAKDAIPNHCQ